jgi:hypothetical protein
VLLIALLLTPAVRLPLGRSLETIALDAFASDAGDLRLEVVDPPPGLRPGHPVYQAGLDRGLWPVAWVVGVEADAVRIRFAPGETVGGVRWRLVALDAPSGLGDAWQVAIPPEVAAELGGRLSARLERLLAEAILPEVQRRLPSFLARVDPRKDPRAREVLGAVGTAVVERVRPYVNELGNAVARDLKDHFDLLDRLGLLWGMVRGDTRGLAKKLLPIAEASVRRWWRKHQDAVLAAAGEAVMDEAPRWQGWLLNEVWSAAREELAEPLLAAKREQIEDAADDAIQAVLDTVVTAPGGGFRTRFAAVLRSRLLEKDEPLLLLEAIE